MTTDRTPPDDREEPPFVTALLLGTFAGVEKTLKRAIQSINRRVQLFLWGGLTLGAFVLIFVLSVIESPGLAGVARGIFAGLFLALLLAVGIGWTLLWANSSRSGGLKETAASAPAVLDTLLAPELRELRLVRADVIRKVKARSVLRVPVGIAAAIVVWILGQSRSDPPGFFELVIFVVIGAVAGEMWAAHKLDREYCRLYKDRVLPRLAARLGDLTYRRASAGDVEKLRVHRILPEYDSVEVEDEIAGTHRSLPLEIVEARLRKHSKDKSRVVFDGLLIELTLPRRLTGTTVVVTDEGMVGNLKARWRSGAMQPVRLEDPRFEAKFEVYSDDQIEARALLTPAFMERFMALASSSGFALPGAIAEGNRLMVALPKGIGTDDLFEPPPYWKPAGGSALLKLEADIGSVLRMADTVIELDFWARSGSGLA